MEILTIEQAAELLHIHPDTLGEKARNGEVPCAKPGRRYIFLKEDLIDWLRSQYRTEKVEEKGKTWPSTLEVKPGGSKSVTKESVSARLQALKTKKRH